MKVPDVNLLVYPANSQAPQYEEARGWLKRSMFGQEVAGLPWISLAGFLRLSIDQRMMPSALTPGEAVTAVEAWLSTPAARQISPGPQHLSILGRLMVTHDIRGGQVTNARLAAIAIEHRAGFATFDSDFHRFAELDLGYLGAR